jgi:hypothetical protein
VGKEELEVALARSCASAEPEPGPPVIGVTRFFLEILGQPFALERGARGVVLCLGQ